jgi:hypothetical protein
VQGLLQFRLHRCLCTAIGEKDEAIVRREPGPRLRVRAPVGSARPPVFSGWVSPVKSVGSSNLWIRLCKRSLPRPNPATQLVVGRGRAAHFRFCGRGASAGPGVLCSIASGLLLAMEYLGRSSYNPIPEWFVGGGSTFVRGMGQEQVPDWHCVGVLSGIELCRLPRR